MSEPETDIRDLLSELSAEGARELGRELDAEGDQYKRRARALFAYAEALGEPIGASPGTRNGSGGASERPTTRVPPSNKRPLIRGLVKERPTPGWSPKEIHEALVERGSILPETSLASIRVTLRRMVERNELQVDPLAKTYGPISDDDEEGSSA